MSACRGSIKGCWNDQKKRCPRCRGSPIPGEVESERTSGGTANVRRMFFRFPPDSRWNAERSAVEFGIGAGEYEGVVRIPKRVFQRLLDQSRCRNGASKHTIAPDSARTRRGAEGPSPAVDRQC